MCEENKVTATDDIFAVAQGPSRPRYHVGANKSVYYGNDFETVEEAVVEATRLALEGYDVVSIRDNDSEGAW